MGNDYKPTYVSATTAEISIKRAQRFWINCERKSGNPNIKPNYKHTICFARATL